MIRNWNDNDNKASQKKSLIKTLEVGFLKLLLAFPPNKQWNHTWETCVPIKYLLISWNHWLTLIIIKISFLWRKTKQNSKSLSALGWTQLKQRQKRQWRQCASFEQGHEVCYLVLFCFFCLQNNYSHGRLKINKG